MPVNIDADRVWLREVSVEEAERLVSSGLSASRGAWNEGYPMEGTIVAARMMRRDVDNGTFRAGFGMYEITLRATGEVIGDIGFHGPPDPHGTVEIGYGIVPAWRGQGLVGEAASALCTWAFAQPGVVTIRARTMPDDVASQGVLKHAGFTDLGLEGDRRNFTRSRPA